VWGGGRRKRVSKKSGVSNRAKKAFCRGGSGPSGVFSVYQTSEKKTAEKRERRKVGGSQAKRRNRDRPGSYLAEHRQSTNLLNDRSKKKTTTKKSAWGKRCKEKKREVPSAKVSRKKHSVRWKQIVDEERSGGNWPKSRTPTPRTIEKGGKSGKSKPEPWKGFGDRLTSSLSGGETELKDSKNGEKEIKKKKDKNAIPWKLERPNIRSLFGGLTR